LENSKIYLERVVQDANQRRVAIVGSGPGGLVAAKYLREHGFAPVIFEQADNIGGQFRLYSLDSLPDAADRISAEARELGTVVGPQFSAEELDQLQVLASARNDPRFTEFVNGIRA
jgi:NADPH-dependent 2,4-dienoyl-CoA reductase/sulfur reductase-like enzyme